MKLRTRLLLTILPVSAVLIVLVITISASFTKSALEGQVKINEKLSSASYTEQLDPTIQEAWASRKPEVSDQPASG